MTNQFEHFWRQEQNEKRKAASGAAHRATRTGRIGRMRMPSDLMDRRQRREYMKPGEVIVYNMYDSVIPKEEFSLLPVEQQRELLLRWRDNPEIGIKGIIEFWKVSRGTYYKKTKELGLTLPRVKMNRSHPSNKREHPILKGPVTEERLSNLFALELTGEYAGEGLADRLEKLGLILNSEAKYSVAIQIKEL